MIATVDQRGSPLSVVGKKRDYISHSAIMTYQQCPLRYRFKYINGLPETVVSSGLIFGGAIHSALEFQFTERLCGNEPPSLDQLLDGYRRGAELLGYCRERLQAVEDQVKLLDDGVLKPWSPA